MHPDIDKLIVEFPYGRILSRPCDKLTPKERELCSLACLAGQIVFPQMHSHILGALNTGASMQEIRSIFDQTGTSSPPQFSPAQILTPPNASHRIRVG